MSQNDTKMCEDYIVYCIPSVVGNALRIIRTVDVMINDEYLCINKIKVYDDQNKNCKRIGPETTVLL